VPILMRAGVQPSPIDDRPANKTPSVCRHPNSQVKGSYTIDI
jgi:hypothetical protein